MRRVVLLCVAADAASGGRPGEDHLPPMFLIPSLCGSRIRAWSTIDCASPGIKITPGADLWVAPALIAAAPRCWSECMRLWGPNMTDMPNCTARAGEGVTSIYNLADGILGRFAHSMSGVVDGLVARGYDPTSLHAFPYDFRVTPEVLETRDGYFSRLKAALEVEVARTGRRAVLYGHSLGTKVAAYFLAWLRTRVRSERARRAWIDERVGMYVANGAPILGAPEIVTTLVVGQTMGLPMKQAQIREVLASSGGIAFLAPSTNNRAPGRKPPAHATPERPTFELDDLRYGPDVCCGPSSLAAGFSRAAEVSGDDLLGDAATMLRRLSGDDPFVGDAFAVSEVRPPVDVVVAAYGVGRRTQLSASFRMVAPKNATPPLGLAALEAAGSTSYDGLPLRRQTALWEAPASIYERGLAHREVVDGAGNEVEAPGPEAAKSGDGTVPYASLSVAHEWLARGANVDVTSVPLRGFFDEAEVVNGTYDADTRAAVWYGPLPQTGEPRMTIFESRDKGRHTEVWEMDDVPHKDSSNHNVFVLHFLREVDEYIKSAATTRGPDEGRPGTHVSGFQPEGDAACYWDYAHARCRNPDACEYRYVKGDLHLTQSCRLLATRDPAPPAAPVTDAALVVAAAVAVIVAVAVLGWDRALRGY